MSGFVNTLEKNNKEFRRDFNRVLRFSNGLYRAESQNIMQQDLETGDISLSNTSESQWLIYFMKAFVNTAQAPRRNDLVWWDTLSFLDEIKGYDKEKTKEAILGFVTKIINNTNNSKHLTRNQKDLILDRLFADPYKNRLYISKRLLPLMGVATCILTVCLWFKFITSYNNPQNIGSYSYLVAALLSFIALCRFCPDSNCEIPGDPIAEDPNSLIAWVNEVSKELLHLKIPCEPDAAPIATTVLANTKDTRNNHSFSKYSISELFNMLSAHVERSLECLFDWETNSVDSLLHANTARRHLDKLITFMSNKVDASGTANSPESAVELYLELRSNRDNMSQILLKFIDDCKVRVHSSTQISDLEKNELLDVILIKPTPKDSFSFQKWLLELDQLCNRLIIAVGEPIVNHNDEEELNAAVSAKPPGYRKDGYTPINPI